MVIGEFVHNPVDQLLQEFAFDRPTGFADGRQHSPSPVLRTALVERTHQKTVRCADELHVAGLPLAVAHLALSQAQLLLTVPMRFATRKSTFLRLASLRFALLRFASLRSAP